MHCTIADISSFYNFKENTRIQIFELGKFVCKPVGHKLILNIIHCTPLNFLQLGRIIK